MARVFITGSTHGLGYLAAEFLINRRHKVVLHARNAGRAKQVRKKLTGAEKVLIADLTSMEETGKLAADVNAMGIFDAVIHNAGVYHVSNEELLAVNTLAPYILTCLVKRPKRLIYLTSGMHEGGNPGMERFIDAAKRVSHYPTYSDTKLHVLMLCLAVARKWPTVYANAVNPGWVPTKMGGAGAPDDLEKGYRTQSWLAVSEDKDAQVTGCYFFHKKQKNYLPVAGELRVQEEFLSACEQITGVSFPGE
ncbi:MAG: SDR family NAD(P)-dependent oxidoreductase [Spirochaetales bacterium]|nr:SDR family NAD(P)-dependent oxidoreductase [Spirochaetales bacterium]